MLSGLLMWVAIYFELFALAAVFRPSLRRLWGVFLVTFHLGTLLIMTIAFSTNIMLLTLLLIAAPGSPRGASLWETMRNMPLIGLLLNRLPKGRRP